MARLGFDDGGLIDRFKKFTDLTDVNARRKEQYSAEIVNRLVDEGVLPEEQRQKLGPVSKGGIRYLQGGKTPAVNDVVHQLFASEVAGSEPLKQGLQRAFLFGREKYQALEKPEDSAIDELNNQIGYSIYKEAKGDKDKIIELIEQRAIEKYKVD